LAERAHGERVGKVGHSGYTYKGTLTQRDAVRGKIMREEGGKRGSYTIGEGR